jgi:hypothetical protein
MMSIATDLTQLENELAAEAIEAAATATATGTVENGVNAFERLSPSTLRVQREELKVSRATLQTATGLSSSVIWRAEQESAKPITDEEYLKIYNVLIEDWTVNGVSAEYAKVTKTHAAPSDGTKDLLKLTGRYHQFLEDLRQSIDDKITITRNVKGRVKALIQLRTELEDFIKTL